MNLESASRFSGFHMRAIVLWMTVLAALVFAPAGFAGIEEVKREPRLEKRAEKAVENAKTKMTEAGAAYRAGERGAMMAALEEMRNSLLLCRKSLEETGKHPKKLSTQYKKAEQGSTAILRLLGDLTEALYAEDRPPVEEIRKSVQALHDEFLSAVMRRK
jgi:hypothetical protein